MVDESVTQEVMRLFNHPAFDTEKRRQNIRSLRNEVEADWISNFMARMQQQPLSGHTTVDSVVQDLRERVKLDAVTEQAGLSKQASFPLSITAAKEDQTEEIKKFIESFLSSHRGHADVPAIFNDIRDHFGNEKIEEIGKAKIEKIISEMKDNFGAQDVNGLLGRQYTGEPQKADSYEATPIFTSIKVK